MCCMHTERDGAERARTECVCVCVYIWSKGAGVHLSNRWLDDGIASIARLNANDGDDGDDDDDDDDVHVRRTCYQ